MPGHLLARHDPCLPKNGVSIMTSMGHRISSLQFVGRSEELSSLQAAMKRSLEGASQVVLIGGEAGVGKTRLVSEFLAWVRETEAEVLTGSCIDLSEGTLPFAPVVEALRSLLRETEAEEVQVLLGNARKELARLLPELGRSTSVAAQSSSRAAPSQARLFEMVLGLLERISSESGAVFVIEDLHWADDSTRDLLTFLTRTMGDARALIVSAYRTDELHRRHPLRPFLAGIDHGPNVERLNLARLDRQEALGQLCGILGETPSSDFAEKVFARSEGNPFFTEELLASGSVEGNELPFTLTEALMLRVEALSDQAQQVLRVAAVAGRAASHGLLASIMLIPDEELVSALREAVDRHLLLPQELTDSYVFRHALLREAVYMDLLPRERSRLHSAFGHVLTEHPELAASEGEPAPAELAHHWYSAHNLEAALTTSVQAGRAAKESYAHAESQRHYERALALWDEVPDAAERLGLSYVELVHLAAEASDLQGDYARATALARSALRLLDPDKQPEQKGLMFERLGRYLWQAGDSQGALDAYREGVRLLPSHPPSGARARVLSAEGQMLMLLGRFQESRARCEEAIDMARAVGARLEEGHALNTLGVDLAFLGDPDSGVDQLFEARRIAQQLDDSDGIARSYVNLSAIYTLAGRCEDAAAENLEGLEVVKQRGMEHSYGAWLKHDLALLWLRVGKWNEADRLITETVIPFATNSTAFMALARGQLATGRGDFVAARTHLDEAQRLSSGIVDPQWTGPFFSARAELAIWEGKESEAAEAVARGLELLKESAEIVHSAWLCMLGMRVEADKAQRGRALRRESTVVDGQRAARPLIGQIRELAERAKCAERVFIPEVIACAASSEAEWARLQGRHEAETWAAAGLKWKQLGQPFRWAETSWREAEAHLNAGRDRKAAEHVLRDAHDVTVRLTAAPLRNEIELLARRARIDLAVVQRPEDAPEQSDRDAISGLGLTDREVEVLKLLAYGRTNAQIAKDLFISSKTASVHVSHILAKLGVSGRVEAAGVAHKAGLLE